MWSPWAYLLLFAIYMARLGQGYVLSIFGPTLLYLSNQVGVEVKDFSLVFSSLYIGFLVGGLIVGFVEHHTRDKINSIYLTAMVMCIEALSAFVVPWIYSFWVMFFVILLGGLSFGYLDAGMQALILRIWGSKEARPLIYLYHFATGLGGFFAPMIAEPFLLSVYGKMEKNAGCPADDSIVTVTANMTLVSENLTETTPQVNQAELYDFNPISWTYIIVGLFLFIISVLVFVLACLKIDAKVSKSFTKQGVEVETRPEEPLCDIITILLPSVFYFFCSITGEIIFVSYIFPVSVCSDLDFSISDASLINSMFWAGSFISRGSGIFTASRIKPHIIALLGIGGSIVMLIAFIFFASMSKWVAWIVALLYGLSMGPLYPSGVTWISKVTNVTGKYMTLFIIGGMTGCIAMLPIGGLLFQSNPYNVIYLALSLNCLNAFVFSLALFAAKVHRRNKADVQVVKHKSEELQTLKAEDTAEEAPRA